VLQLIALLGIPLDGGALPATVGPAEDRRYHVQIARQFGQGGGWRLRLAGPLGFPKQLRLFKNPLADGGRSLAPGCIQLAGLARIALMLGEDGCHALAVLQALPRDRQQKLHRHLGHNLALAHLLLDGLWQELHQRQPPRHPTHAAIEAPRQLIQAVAKTLLQFDQQPADLQCGLAFGKAQRAIQ
jgi:hypothetical protein